MTTFIKAPRQGFMMQGKLRGGDPPVKPRRFLVFAGENYYPAGGWDDLIGSADKMEDAQAAAREADQRGDWVQVIDLETGKPIDWESTL